MTTTEDLLDPDGQLEAQEAASVPMTAEARAEQARNAEVYAARQAAKAEKAAFWAELTRSAESILGWTTAQVWKSTQMVDSEGIEFTQWDLTPEAEQALRAVEAKGRAAWEADKATRQDAALVASAEKAAKTVADMFGGKPGDYFARMLEDVTAIKAAGKTADFLIAAEASGKIIRNRRLVIAKSGLHGEAADRWFLTRITMTRVERENADALSAARKAAKK